MINCPQCHVPNPDGATTCMSCGTPLAGQEFAQALDAAQSGLGQGSPVTPAGYGLLDGAAGVDPGLMAQAEINQFMAEQRLRKRTRRFVYAAIAVAILGVVGFILVRNARKKEREETVARFFEEFRKIDDGPVSDFWKCAVRAKDRDVRLAAGASEVTEGLEQAFSNFPKSQPGTLLDKCIPMINGILEETGKLQPPEGFASPLEDYKGDLKAVQQALTVYAKKIEKRKQQAMDEQEIREGHAHFHQVIGSNGGWAPVQDTPKALAYFNILKCAIPDLIKAARKVTKPPDTQYIVEYVYNTCKKDSSFADKLRGECFKQRESVTMRGPDFKTVAQKISGDDRDLFAINDCFRRANQGFAFEELKGVAQAFGNYRNRGRRAMLEAVKQVKDELKK